MTLDEKVALTYTRGDSGDAGVPRLGIPRHCHCTITASSLHHHRTIIAPSLHHHCTAREQTLREQTEMLENAVAKAKLDAANALAAKEDIITAPSLHHH